MREGSASTASIRAAVGARRGDTVEPQVWGEGRTFAGEIYIGKRGPALENARGWRARDTAWTDGSRLDTREVGATFAWKRREGVWRGRRFRLGTYKEIFDAEVSAIYQALKAFNEAQGSGRRYTVFADSQAAIQRIRTDVP